MDDVGIPLSLYSEPETSLMQLSQLKGTAKVVWNGAIIVGSSMDLKSAFQIQLYYLRMK